MMETPLFTDGTDIYNVPLFTKDIRSMLPSILSVISTFIVVIVSIYGKFWKKTLSTMIFSINLADFIFFSAKTFVLLYQPITDYGCQILQVICTFGLISSVTWGCIFGHAFYMVLKYKNLLVLNNYWRVYLTISIMVPLMALFGVFFTDNIRYVDGDCIYQVIPDKLDYLLLLRLHGPIVICIIMNVVWYILAIRILRGIVFTGSLKETLTLMIYPGILIVCLGPIITVHTLIQFGVRPETILVEWMRGLAYSMGFFDAMIYGEGVKSTSRNLCRKRCRFGRQSIKGSRTTTNELEETFLASKPRVDFHESIGSVNSLTRVKLGDQDLDSGGSIN